MLLLPLKGGATAAGAATALSLEAGAAALRADRIASPLTVVITVSKLRCMYAPVASV
jgi:hypothetical protein